VEIELTLSSHPSFKAAFLEFGCPLQLAKATYALLAPLEPLTRLIQDEQKRLAARTAQQLPALRLDDELQGLASLMLQTLAALFDADVTLHPLQPR
jgi:hypothetical protein